MTLFGVHPDDLKACVYEMRFDEASARYAEFGPFWTGMVDDGRGRARQRAGRLTARPADASRAPVAPSSPTSARRASSACAPSLTALGGVVVAFSGGADSAFLAKVATDTLGPDRVLCVTAVSAVPRPRGARRLRGAGRGVGSALAARSTTDRARRPRLRGQRHRPLLPLQVGAHGRPRRPRRPAPTAAPVVLGVNLDDLDDHRPGQRGRGRAWCAVPARGGRAHQGRRARPVAPSRSAHVGQAGGGLPGVAPALRDAGDRVDAVVGGRRRVRVCARSGSGGCGSATTASWRVSSSTRPTSPPRSSAGSEVVAAVQGRRVPLRDPRPRGPALGQPERSCGPCPGRRPDPRRRPGPTNEGGAR